MLWTPSTHQKDCARYRARARDAIAEVLHPAFGSLKMQNVAPRLSDTPGSIVSCGPELGQHNREVFEGILKMDRSTLSALMEKGIIGTLDKNAAEVPA